MADNYPLNSIRKILLKEGGIIVCKPLSHAIGLREALVFGELVSKFEYFKKKGGLLHNHWFYCSYNNLQIDTNIPVSGLRKITNTLKEIGLIDKKIAGMPQTTHYSITIDVEGVKSLLKEGKAIMDELKQGNLIKQEINNKALKEYN